MRKGFTLIELLTVIGIIALLAAILFPVFNAARRKGKTTTCISNLNQIGKSMSMYGMDANDKFPWAVDPTDKYTPQIWDQYPEWQKQIPFMPFLHEVLQPYQKSKEIWLCPGDNGMYVEDFNDQELFAQPTFYKKFGTSYVFRTEIAFRQIRFTNFKDGARINVLFDAAGHWHLGWAPILPTEDFGTRFDKRRQYVYNVLFGDLHVKQQTYDQVTLSWQIPL